MTNKQIGTEFEREVVRLLSRTGYWVHFIVPDARGSQPFDIIASKDDAPIVGDCKTCKSRWFTIERLEETQKTSLDLWLAKGNKRAYVFIKHEDSIYQVPYPLIKALAKIDLNDDSMEQYLLCGSS